MGDRQRSRKNPTNIYHGFGAKQKELRMNEATLKDAILVERASTNTLLKDVDADIYYWKTLLRFNREESKMIHDKLKEIEIQKDRIEWKV